MPMTKDTAGDEAPLNVGTGLISGTTAQSVLIDVRDKDAVSLQLIVDFQSDAVQVTGTDGVVSGTGVWTFANYTFTGLTGAKLVVAGAANAGNNGTFTITAVSGHTATTATTGLVTETFSAATTTLNVIRSETASVPAGTWTIFGSNDYVPGVAGSSSGAYGAPATAGHFFDVKALFSKPTTVAVVATANAQYVQADPHFDGRTLKVTFTPSAGIGTVQVAPYRKNWSR